MLSPCVHGFLLVEIYKANREILSNAESWDLFKKDIKNLAIEISTKRRKENDYEIKNLNKTFQDMRTHIDGGNSSVEDRILYEDTRQEIVMKNKEKEEGQRIRAKVEKIQFDEKSSKYFFSREKARAETKQINILRNKDKKGLEDKESILKEIQNFYTTLYTVEGIDINQVNANLKFIDKTLSNMDNESLNDFISPMK